MSHFRSFGLHVGTSSDLERECVGESPLFIHGMASQLGRFTFEYLFVVCGGTDHG